MINNVIPINTMPDGSCRTLKYQYFKTSIANFEKTGTWGATGVALIKSEEENNNLETQEEFIKKVKIRKLTPAETFLLQGMTVEDCKKCQDIGLSDSALYKITGNGLVSQCV